MRLKREMIAVIIGQNGILPQDQDGPPLTPLQTKVMPSSTHGLMLCRTEQLVWNQTHSEFSRLVRNLFYSILKYSGLWKGQPRWPCLSALGCVWVTRSNSESQHGSDTHYSHSFQSLSVFISGYLPVRTGLKQPVFWPLLHWWEIPFDTLLIINQN